MKKGNEYRELTEKATLEEQKELQEIRKQYMEDNYKEFEKKGYKDTPSTFKKSKKSWFSKNYMFFGKS